ncbi:unnamed protein product [Ostreobium quekettii]|uniref:MLO-like protein n=1 Tax=Ostreobium quekettii TaxID=121088 RepID=A0A8S1ISF7_9CHLO|nr:unnamed protein product [Ostreobium quekettii]|eukprot:evm.model.scf_841EXC.1 EVM.evm.TU.scf_841EXC.1   scf_841EXC:714-6486(-)
MAGANDPSLTETPEYRIVIIFVAFILVTYLFEKGMEWIDEYLKHHKRRGLLHTIHKLEEELLALGLISLMLIAVEDYLVEICVDGTNAKGAKKAKLAGDKAKLAGDDKKKAADAKKAASKAATPVQEDILDDYHDEAMADAMQAELDGAETEDAPAVPVAAADDVGVATDASLLSDDFGNRRLLGGVVRTLLASAGGDGPCPVGQESFWSIRAIHETHIFIFVLAVVHIIYAGVSMVLCAWKVGQWKRWERNAHTGLRKIDYRHLLDESNVCLHWGRSFFAQFHQHIDESVYLGLRRLFIERMQVDNSFDFHKFLVNSMEEEFSKVVSLDWAMWAVAAIWIWTTPIVVYVMFVGAVVLTFLAGTKLESIALKLGNEAYTMYADKAPPGHHKHHNPIMRNLQKISMTVSKALHSHSHHHHHRNHDEQDTVHGHSRGHHSRGHSHGPSQRDSAYNPEMRHQKSGPVGEGYEEYPSDGRQSRESMASKDGSLAMSLPESDNEISYAASVSSSIAHSDAALLWRQSNNNANHYSDQLSQTSVDPVRAPTAKHQRMGSRLYSNIATPRTSREHHPEPEIEAPALHCCCMQCFGGKKKEDHSLDAFADEYMVPDSIGLFPFKRPRLMLQVFQHTYFLNSLLMAILLFNLWQEVDPHLILTSDWISLTLVIVGIVVMFITSILLLPVYGLTMVTGSHCPSKVLKRAKKHHINPHAVHTLERMSMAAKSMNLSKTSMALGRTSMGVKGAGASSDTDDNGSVIGAGAAMPTHWSDMSGMQTEAVRDLAKEVVHHQQPEEPEEEDEHKAGGALSMLVGAMLKTKTQEGDNTLERTSSGGHHASVEMTTPSGQPTLLRKSRTLLSRVSIPLIDLPDIKEVASPKAAEQDNDEGSQHSGAPSLMRRSRSLLSRLSMSSKKSVKYEDEHETSDAGEVEAPKKRRTRVTFEEPKPAPENHSSGGEAPEVKGILRRTKSVNPKLLQESSGPSLGRMSVGAPSMAPSAPSLKRASMPFLKVVEKKQQAYLEKSRADADHLMHEGSEVQSPKPADTSAAPEASQANSDNSSDDTCEGGSVRRPNSHAKDPHPTMDQVAELFKLGEKQKLQKE